MNEAKKECPVCGKPKSKYLLNNKLVCLRCDELLFDIEIEVEEETKPIEKEPTLPKRA